MLLWVAYMFLISRSFSCQATELLICTVGGTQEDGGHQEDASKEARGHQEAQDEQAQDGC